MDDEIRKILDNFFATHELPKVNYVLKSDDDETENNHPLQLSEEATIQTVPQTFEPTVPDYYPDAPPYSPPFDKYSDMLKACKLAMADLPKWCDYINEARSTVHEMPVRRLYLSPKDFTIKYSQPSESLRIISERYNICVTVRYNYWDDERDEFTDKAFFYTL